MDEAAIPELRQIVGALLFAARKPLTAGEIRRVLQTAASDLGGLAKDFGEVTERQVREVLDALRDDLADTGLGFQISEVAKGFRLENLVNCGPWVRQMLEKGKAPRLSRPALETLAIIAYRQPVVRSEIESVRGVAVDQIVRNLMEMQLIRVVGRSDLPGRPWLFGTTRQFLEHFGLRDLNDLPGVDELRRVMKSGDAARETRSPAAAQDPSGTSAESGGESPVAQPAEKEEGEAT